MSSRPRTRTGVRQVDASANDAGQTAMLPDTEPGLEAELAQRRFEKPEMVRSIRTETTKHV